MEKVLLSGTFIKGPVVETFEQNLAAYTGSNHIISCANGTDALMIAFMALDLPPGSEVITPAFSYAAVAETLHLLNLKPVYADVNPKTFLLDENGIESLITEKTKAIVPVHLFGQSCNMEPIMALANKYGLYVIEDNAQAIGAKFTFADGSVKQTGTIGHIGTTSFFPTKNLGCYGDGGALFVQDHTLAEKVRMIANHGQRTKYIHELVGVNSRLDALQAAVLNVKLNHLNEFERSRNQSAGLYDQLLSSLTNIELPYRVPYSTHVFHQYTLQTKSKQDRDGLKEYLTQKQIPSMVYYPIPLFDQVAYKQNCHMPVSESLCDTVLSLPMHTELNTEQIEFITNTLKEYYKS